MGNPQPAVARSVSEGDVAITPSRTVKEGAGANKTARCHLCLDPHLLSPLQMECEDKSPSLTLRVI